MSANANRIQIRGGPDAFSTETHLNGERLQNCVRVELDADARDDGLIFVKLTLLAEVDIDVEVDTVAQKELTP